MPHLSENAQPLNIHRQKINPLADLKSGEKNPAVLLFSLPSRRSDTDAAASDAAFSHLAAFCKTQHEQSLICVLTSPPDAARLMPYLESVLHFQLWVVLQTAADKKEIQGELPSRHMALLILTRHQTALPHTKTRIGYSYCPACGKTTKDYGGKKHTYHGYGTLMSDVWRDIEIAPDGDLSLVETRLADLFGLAPYNQLFHFDLRFCRELLPQPQTPSAFMPALGLSQNKQSRLIQGDCLETLRDFPANSFDFCFADPPYNLKKKYDKWDDAQEITDYFAWCDLWLGELCRVIKPGHTVAVLNIPLWAVRHYQFLAQKMNFQAWIAWDALGFPVRRIMPAHYAIVCFTKGSARPLPGRIEAKEAAYLRPQAEGFCLRSGCLTRRRAQGMGDTQSLGDLWADVHRLKHNSRRVSHPCQLPPLLMQRLFALFTRPNEIILDCFNGAGTSTLVAQQMNRRFVGVELSEPYHEMAQARHAQIANGQNPFDKNAEVPGAKNSQVRRVTKQNYVVSKKTLQLDVRRIARALGRLPSRAEVAQLSPFPFEYFEQYFVSWGEVCAAARTTGMSELPAPNLSAQIPLNL